MSKIFYGVDVELVERVKVVVSEYALDNRIVLKKRKAPVNGVFTSHDVSIWDLDTGIVSGNCSRAEATEWHMSAKNYAKLQKIADGQEAA